MKRFLILIYLFLLGIGSIKAQVIDTIKRDTLKFIPNQKPIITIGEPSNPNQQKQENAAATGNERGHSGTNQMSLSSTYEVGKSQISVDVSATGAGTFSMPIVVPQGISGFMPEIALAYSSQYGNGIAGYGWSLAGSSSITRIPKTKAIDGEIGAVNFDENDRFALDGQRLILKSGTYGGNNSEYVTENYSNLRIFCKAQGQNPYDGSETSFEVWFPDGSKAFYGILANSRTQLEYAISYRENPIGVRINYLYNNTSNVLYLSQISYGGLANQTMFNKIDFFYTTAQRAEQVYVGGLSVYRNKLLSKISVSVNETYIRHYILSHTDLCEIDYQRLSSLTEWNGQETKSLIPIYFNYSGEGGNIYMPPQTITNFGVSGITNENAEAVFADFTGNGITDMIIYPKVKDKFWVILDPENQDPFNTHMVNGYFKEVFTATTLTHNNKILAGQNILVVRDQGTSYKFEIRSTELSSPLAYQYDRVWDNLPMAPPYFSEVTYQYHDGAKIEQQFLSGDFNGDGLTDVIAIGDSQVITYEWVDWTSPYSGTGYTYGDIGSNAYLINLDRRITTNNIINLGTLTQSYSNGDKLYTADFNGDGKTDILHIKNGVMLVYTVTSNNTIELLWQPTTDPRIVNSNLPIMLGDYNGDGKTDIMFATASHNNYLNNQSSKLYATFMSTGKGFVKHEQTFPFSSNWGSTGGKIGNQAVENRAFLIPTDINGDGKTDIVWTNAYSLGSNPNGEFRFIVYDNISIGADAKPVFAEGLSDWRTFPIWYDAIPVMFPNHLINSNLEIGFLSGNALNTYAFTHNERNTSLSSVWQNYVSYSIEYEKLMSNGYSGIYSNNSAQTYPNIDIQNVPTFSVVSRIERRFTNQQILQQTFRYENAVTNTEGLGFLGFGKTIRSNWHVDDYDENRLYNITLSDPQLRGAPIKTFTAKEAYLDPSIANSTAATPNITLSSPITTTETTEASNSITFLDGFEANGTNGVYIAQITNAASGINDAATINDYLTRTDYTYNTQLLPNKVFINTPTSVATKDLLNGTNTLQLNEYDNYYNVTKSTTNLSGAGTKTEEITYDNNPSGYYIGRPLARKTTMSAAGDTYSTEDEYDYNGGSLPKIIKKKGHGTPWLTENLTYDTFGNIAQKSISTASGTRTTSATYDVTGRFPISQTDVEGMVSTATFDPVMGTMLTSTNSYGQTTTNVYDTWGRLTETTDYLGKKAYQSFASDGYGGAIINKSNDEGSESTAYINALGQTTQSTEKTITGSYVGTATEYDVYGRAYRQSQPAAPGGYNQWNETEFDEYGRVNKTTAYTGKVVNYSYSGLSATVNDGTKSVTTTKNTLGQTVSAQDPGGTINYSYYAHGGLKSTDYGGSIQSLEYDGWGRKTKLTDPSAGAYTYTYNHFGEITQETTPKGVTNYTYDNATGKLMSKTLNDGAPTPSLAYAYTYNNTTKLLKNLVFTNTDGNNATYTYTYDPDKRLTSTVENNLHAVFTKSYTYDDFDRIATETYQAEDKATNTTATRTVAYTYQNGELLQAVDQTTGKILSKVNTLKPNGQLATELQGGSLKTTYNYDTYNLPQSIITERIGTNPATLMNLGYGFDALRGNLNSRSNSALSWNETFEYDEQDRLKKFIDVTGTHTQTYDARGRITNNSQLGNYGYSGVGYQQTDLTNPTPEATTWYQDRALQQLTFNAFKKPVNINEQGKDQIDFQYNAALQRSTMYYGSDDADKELRPMRRHYSEDGGMEITRNIAAGETSFVFYLSGDAYDAPAIYKEVHNSNGTTQDLYYLHRDHLGSIVLITDVDGNAVEKRQFDAWGNIVALTDGNGNPLTAFVITDRGYTGHEHLLGVGLINMNGRLYDPMLHRFVSPDNFVQDPTSTQNFNRYGYAMNNPLIYTDPSGEIIQFIIAGAIIGALTGGVSYAASAIRTGDWSWKGLGMSMLTGAVIGGITGGVNPASLISNSLGNTFATAFVGGLMPSANLRIGNFGFSISPSLAFGQSFGIGANIGLSYSNGHWNFSAGLGVMQFGNYQGFGKSGMEIRSSLMAGFDDGTTRLSLSTSWFSGTENMKEFKQRTTMFTYGHNDFSFGYENDGSPFSYAPFKFLSNNTDVYRTNSVYIGVKEYSLNLNMFTGRSGNDSNCSDCIDKTAGRSKKGNALGLWSNPEADKYRMGVLSLSYRGFNVGVNSEHVRDAFQNWFAHKFVSPQPGFRMLSRNWDLYSQFRTENKYSRW